LFSKGFPIYDILVFYTVAPFNIATVMVLLNIFSFSVIYTGSRLDYSVSIDAGADAPNAIAAISFGASISSIAPTTQFRRAPTWGLLRC
jgi:hypothetical protein